MINLEKDLTSLLEQHLPQQVGETLKKQLDKLANLEKEFEDLSSVYRNKCAQVTELQNDIQNLSIKNRALENDADSVKTLGDSLQFKERELIMRETRIATETIEKDMHKLRANDMKDIIYTIFKNPVMQNSVFESEAGNWNWDPAKNMNVFVPSGSKSKTETKQINS